MGFLIAIISIVAVFIAGGAIAAITIIKRKQTSARDTQRVEKAALEVATSAAMDRIDAAESSLESDTNEYDADPNYKVDENGCEWWLDDDQKWWFRTPEMDDWMEHTGE